MMYIAWQHNSQGELHEAGRIHWGPWLAVGASWFALPFSLGAIIAAGLWFERKRGPAGESAACSRRRPGDRRRVGEAAPAVIPRGA